MASMLQSRTSLRVQAVCMGCAPPLSLRSVHAGSLTRKQQPQRVGLQQQLVPSPVRPIGYGMSGATSPVTLRQTTIMRSFLGVGAPEAILVAVVALVVFGPKGLADAAKSLGQTLRAFQPTIKEVVEVSQEIKGTLEQELGLDELRNAATMRPTPRPIQPDASSSSSGSSADSAAAGEAGSSSSSSGSSGSSADSPSSSSTPSLRAVTEDVARQIDPEIELKRAMSEQAAWGGQAPAANAGSTAAAVAAAVAAAPAASGGDNPAADAAAGANKDLSTLSLGELEAELARRRKAA